MSSLLWVNSASWKHCVSGTSSRLSQRCDGGFWYPWKNEEWRTVTYIHMGPKKMRNEDQCRRSSWILWRCWRRWSETLMLSVYYRAVCLDLYKVDGSEEEEEDELSVFETWMWRDDKAKKAAVPLIYFWVIIVALISLCLFTVTREILKFVVELSFFHKFKWTFHIFLNPFQIYIYITWR